MAGSIKVLIADDHGIVRDGLRSILAANVQLALVGIATSFTEVLDHLKTTRIDVIVLDLGGMGGAPLTFVTRLRREYPHVNIVVFSSSVDLAPELLQAGIHGYVVKEELSSQLIHAVQVSTTGRQFLSPLVHDYMTRSEARNHKQTLTPQELNVLKHLARGLGTAQIASQLEIDPRVVYNYLSNLYRKTGCTERTQLAAWYKRMYGSGMEDTGNAGTA